MNDCYITGDCNTCELSDDFRCFMRWDNDGSPDTEKCPGSGVYEFTTTKLVDGDKIDSLVNLMRIQIEEWQREWVDENKPGENDKIPNASVLYYSRERLFKVKYIREGIENDKNIPLATVLKYVDNPEGLVNML